MAASIEIFQKTITSGIVLSKFNLCCPDCNGAYLLSNFQDFYNYYDSYLKYQSEDKDVGTSCCLSLYLNNDDWASFQEAYSSYFPNLQHIITADNNAYTQCGPTSDFMFYINQLSTLLGIYSYVGTNFISWYVSNFGIVEMNTLGGHSGLKIIYEFLSSTGLTQAENQQLFMKIMGNPKVESVKNGIVIRCINDDIIMSDTKMYDIFLSQFFGTELYLCFKTQRSINGKTLTYTYINVLPQANLVNGKSFYVIPYNESGVTGTYYIFWSSVNNRWEVWSGFNSTTNTGTGTFHSSLNNSSLDIFLTTIDWDQQTTITNGQIIDSSLKVECLSNCNFKSENGGAEAPTAG